MARAPHARPWSPKNTGGVARDGWQPDAWTICPELADIPLRELIPGFDTIADLDVPYARLPRRLGLYAERFRRWSDLAGDSYRTRARRELLAKDRAGSNYSNPGRLIFIRRPPIDFIRR